MTGRGRTAALVVGVLAAGLAGASPAAAENPVLDDETMADIAGSLADATDTQGVCYGLRLEVSDFDSGRYTGRYVASSAGVGADLPSPTCTRYVLLGASIAYTSEFSEAADSASVIVESNVPDPPLESDLARLGLTPAALLDDSRSEQALLNAVLLLPALTAERANGVPPLVLSPATDAPPSDARPTGAPGSDVWRQNGGTLTLLVLLVLACLAWAVWTAVRREPTPGRYEPYGRAVRTAFGGGRPDPGFPASYDQGAYDPGDQGAGNPYERRYGQPRPPTDPESY